MISQVLAIRLVQWLSWVFATQARKKDRILAINFWVVGMCHLACLWGNPGTITISQCRLNETKQHIRLSACIFPGTELLGFLPTNRISQAVRRKTHSMLLDGTNHESRVEFWFVEKVFEIISRFCATALGCELDFQRIRWPERVTNPESCRALPLSVVWCLSYPGGGAPFLGQRYFLGYLEGLDCENLLAPRMHASPQALWTIFTY